MYHDNFPLTLRSLQEVEDFAKVLTDPVTGVSDGGGGGGGGGEGGCFIWSTNKHVIPTASEGVS